MNHRPSSYSSSTSNPFLSAFSSSSSSQYSSFSFSNSPSSSSLSSSPFSFALPNPSSFSSSSGFSFTSPSSSSPFANPSPSSAFNPSFGFGSSTSSFPFSVSAANTAAPLLFGTMWGWVSSSPCANSALFGSLVPDSTNPTMFRLGSSSGPDPGPTTTTSAALFGSVSWGPGSTTKTLFGSSSSNSVSVSTGSISTLFGSGSSSGPVSTASSTLSGYDSSSLFSTFKTTTDPSILVATTTSYSSPAFTAFGVSCSPSSTTAATNAATSSLRQQSSAACPLIGTPFSLPESCSGCSAIFVKVGLADEEEKVPCEQLKDRVVKQSIVQTANRGPGEEELQNVRQDEDEKGDVWEGVETTVVPNTRTSLNGAEVVTLPMLVSAARPIVPTVEATVVTTGALEVESFAPGDVVVTPPGIEVDQEEPCENASSEAAAPWDGMIEYTLSPEKGFIIKKVFAKYGDITLGSILKSTGAKSAFLELVADAVDRLCTYTLDTLDSNELQLIQKQVADAVTVGFNVEWLQQRVDKVSAASKYIVRTMELEELGQQIDAAKKSLMEMESRQMVWTKELHGIKAEIEGSSFSRSNLGEGLL